MLNEEGQLEARAGEGGGLGGGPADVPESRKKASRRGSRSKRTGQWACGTRRTERRWGPKLVLAKP